MSNRNNNNSGNKAGSDSKPSADSAPVTEASPPQISDDPPFGAPATTGASGSEGPPPPAAGDAAASAPAATTGWSRLAVKNADGATIAFVRLAPDMPIKAFADQFYGGNLRHKLVDGRNPPPVKGVEIEILETELCPTIVEGQLSQFACKAKVELRDGCATIHQLCGLILEDKVNLVEA